MNIQESGLNKRDRIKESYSQYNAKLRQILLEKDKGAAIYHEKTEHMMRVINKFEDGLLKDSARFMEGFPESLR